MSNRMYLSGDLTNTHTQNNFFVLCIYFEKKKLNNKNLTKEK